MTTGFSEMRVRSSQDEHGCIAGASTGDVLRLLSAGPAGAILMALGDGPLRTKALTERVPGYARRTIYRYAGKLAELDVVDREEEPGVPSKVVHTLSEPCGTDLHSLVIRFADASFTRLPDGRIDAQTWGSLGLLADLWEAGLVDELSCEPRSSTELARGPHGLSYHQVNRRAGLFKTAGLLADSDGPGRRRNYELTRKTRRTMGLIAEIARWRHDHVVGEDEEGMTATEMAAALRAALPLARSDRHDGKSLELRVIDKGATPGAEGESESVWAEVEGDGTIHSCAGPGSSVDGSAWGKVAAWIPAVLDGQPQKVSVGGDEELVGDSLAALHEALWGPGSF